MAQLWETGLCIPPLPILKLLCSFEFLSNTWSTLTVLIDHYPYSTVRQMITFQLNNTVFFLASCGTDPAHISSKWIF